MHKPIDFAQNRQRVLDALQPDEAILVFGAPTRPRNGDSDYRYRPDSDVYWLTGWEDPDVAVFLKPGEAPLTLFVQPKDPVKELWDGFRPGPEGAVASYGADEAFPIGELPKELPRLIQGVSRLHHVFARDSDHDALVMGAIARAARAGRRNGLTTPETFHHPSLLLHELRLVKTDEELGRMRRAAEVTCEAHRRAMQATSAGSNEYEIEATLLRTFQESGSTGPGYTPIVAGGNNANVLHYNRNREVLPEGGMLLVDAGCECGFYTADVTRTWPISGRFTEAQRAVYEVVLAAQDACIETARVGVAHSEIHWAAVRALTEGMVALGLLEGEVDTLIQDESYKRWYPHGTSHWLGLDVHDVGSYGRDGRSRPLQAGMVLTIEPGLYIPEDAEDAPEHLRGIGVRIEDDILITASGPENLTLSAPRTVDEIEAWMAESR